jgi:glycosyltransferase involved in cell wall biosynthesis
MWNNKSVSVVLPAYNEESSIRRAVEEFLATEVVDEVVVINNNSRDRTLEEASSTPAKVLTETTQGYGAALTRGLKEAGGDYIVLAEPDCTFIPKDILKLLCYAEDFDMVCGTRTTRELVWDQANMGWFLRVGNFVVAKLLEVLHNTCSMSDCGCTFRLVRREGVERFVHNLTVKESHFLPEMIILARRAGLSIIEIPLNYRERQGQSKITGSWRGVFQTGLRMIRLIVAYKFSRHGYPRRAPPPLPRPSNATQPTPALAHSGMRQAPKNDS